MSSVVSEKTEYRELPDGIVFFDQECSSCASLAARLRPFLRSHRMDTAPLQEPWAAALFGPNADELKFVSRNGRVSGGADALIELASRIWWTRPLAALARHPRLRAWLQRRYRWVASRRACSARARHPKGHL